MVRNRILRVQRPLYVCQACSSAVLPPWNSHLRWSRSGEHVTVSLVPISRTVVTQSTAKSILAEPLPLSIYPNRGDSFQDQSQDPPGRQTSERRQMDS